MDLTQLEPNSHKYNDEKGVERHIQKVVSGEVKTRNRSLRRRFTDVFFDQDVGDIKAYLFVEVFIPAVKNLIMDMVNQGLGMKFYGSSRPYYKANTNGGNNKTPYGSFYRTGGQQSTNKPARPEYSRVSNGMEDIILETKGEAEQVIVVLTEMIDMYGQATLADLYEAVGKTSNWASNSVGWFDLKGARAVRVRDGYLLDLPRPVSLK